MRTSAAGLAVRSRRLRGGRPAGGDLQAHSAPLGLRFYDGTAFPEALRGDLFVALHGSWNRSVPVGYKLIRIPSPTNDQLARIGAAVELLIATRRRDGTLRNPLSVWIVRRGDDLYVRSVSGHSAAWYRRALTTHAGHVSAGGVDEDVDLVETGDLNDQIDAAYETKYGRRYPTIVPSIVNEKARAATLELVPAD